MKILVQGQPTMESLKVELTTESDLFFHYTHIADEGSFRIMQDEQKLMVDFADYGNVLARSLNAAIKEPHRYTSACLPACLPAPRCTAHCCRGHLALTLLLRLSHLAVFVMHTDGHARLDFIQVRGSSRLAVTWLRQLPQ